MMRQFLNSFSYHIFDYDNFDGAHQLTEKTYYNDSPNNLINTTAYYAGIDCPLKLLANKDDTTNNFIYRLCKHTNIGLLSNRFCCFTEDGYIGLKPIQPTLFAETV